MLPGTDLRLRRQFRPGAGGRLAVWEAEIEAGDATGVEHRLDLTLRKADRLRFVVEKRGQYFCDTTRWDPTVAYAGGESYRASEGFSKAPEEENPWRYELELPAGSPGRFPCLRGYGKDLDLRWKELRPGVPVRSSEDELPAWLLADLKEKLPADESERRAVELARLAVYLRARWWKRTLALSNPLFPRERPRAVPLLRREAHRLLLGARDREGIRPRPAPE